MYCMMAHIHHVIFLKNSPGVSLAVFCTHFIFLPGLHVYVLEVPTLALRTCTGLFYHAWADACVGQW